MGGPFEALGINPLFLLSQIVNIGILFIVLRLFLWKPMIQRLEERRVMLRKQKEDAEAISKSRAEIEQERERVLNEARSESERVLAEARKESREIAEQARGEARAERERVLTQAAEEAEEERNRLLGQMREQIAALAIAAANKLVGEALDEQRQRALVAAFFSGVRDGRVEVVPEGIGEVAGPVVITSAMPLTDDEKAAIQRDLAERLGQADLKVSYRVDPQILGGLIVRVGDRLINGSVAGRLEQLQQTLS
ncbi:MAG: F0F1 ATP synthase subunit B [Anaerolineae bacterium]|nr:F0F1 ATP synthase subunit B [Anaerolineae bacterium]